MDKWYPDNDIDKMLNKYLIPDLTNIVIQFMFNDIDKFDKKIMKECMESGDYMYQTKDMTLLHYMYDNQSTFKVTILFRNSKYTVIEHFQNKNKNNNTELHNICMSKGASKILDKLKLIPEHFQNKNKDNRTELYNLCRYKIFNVILSVQGWEPKHFTHRNNKNTALYWLCKLKAFNVVTSIDGWTEEHCNGNGMIEKYMTEINMGESEQFHNPIDHITTFENLKNMFNIDEYEL